MTKIGNNLPRIAIDTNLVISGTIFLNSVPSQLITSWINGGFNWIQTQETFGEIKEVLNRKDIKTTYRLNQNEIQAFLDNLSVGAEFVKPTPIESLPIHCRDEKDDILLACAFGGNCNFLISGDEDLLVLNDKKELGNLEIIRVVDYLGKKL